MTVIDVAHNRTHSHNRLIYIFIVSHVLLYTTTTTTVTTTTTTTTTVTTTTTTSHHLGS